MPNWKKVVISGSSPEFNNVTLDGTLNIPGFSNLSSSLASLETSDSTKITNAGLVYTSSGAANSSQPTHITNVDGSLKVIATGSRSVILNASKFIPNIISGSYGQHANEVIVNGVCNVIKQTGVEASTVTNSNVVILNGYDNFISSSVNSSILAGACNKIYNGRNGFIGGGNGNCLIGDFYSGGSCVLIGNSIVGGQHNRISGSSNPGNTNWWNTIAGGEFNRLYNTGCSIIGAGHCNRVLGNNACFDNSNKRYHENSIVAGRCNDIIDERNSHIIGGACNKIIGDSTQNTSLQGSGNIIGAGHCNVITGSYCSAILGGKENCLKHGESFIIGSCITSSAGCTTFVNNLCVLGNLNTDGTDSSIIYENGTGAGSIQPIANSNNASGTCSNIGGGKNNTVSNCYSAIGGGRNNTVSGKLSTIGGGNSNTVLKDNSFIGGGLLNSVSGSYGFIGGGQCHIITGSSNTIAGGRENHIRGSITSNATVAGGFCNKVCARQSTIGGGFCNDIQNDGTLSVAGATIGGGVFNTICGVGLGSTIGGGQENIITKNYSFIGGGVRNFIDNSCGAVIAGGCYNTASGNFDSIVGGCENKLDSPNLFKFIGGGCQNYNSGGCSAILGGKQNCLTHANSFIIGSNLTSSAACTTFVNNLNVSGSLNGSTITGVTASFGKYIGIPSSDPFPYTASSGPAIISQSFTAGNVDSTALRLLGSGSVSQSGIFEVEGSAGPLFSVQDGLDGVLMEVNNISGLPLFQVSSSNEVFVNRGNLTSGVNTATASFAMFSGSFQGDGSQLTNLNTTTPTLQQVTDQGATTTNDITITGSLNVSGSSSPLISLPDAPTNAVTVSGSNGTTSINIYDSVDGIRTPTYNIGAGLRLVSGEGSGRSTLDVSAVGSDNGGGSEEQAFIHSNQQLSIRGNASAAGDNIKFLGSHDSYGLKFDASTSGVTLTYNTNGGATVSELNMGNGTYIQAAANGTYYKIGRSSTDWLNLSSTKATFAADVSSSATSTASFGHYIGDGSQLTNLPAASAGSTAGRVVFTTTSGELTTESGFDYDSTTNQLTVESLNVTHFTSSFITSSQVLSSGSNILGDDVSDTQTLIGTTLITGSAQITGSTSILGALDVIGDAQITGSLIVSGSFEPQGILGNSTSVVIGKDATASGNGISIGKDTSGNPQGVSIGVSSVSGQEGVSIGYESGYNLTTGRNINIGTYAQGRGTNSIMLKSTPGFANTNNDPYSFGVYMTSDSIPDFQVVGGSTPGISRLISNLKISSSAPVAATSSLTVHGSGSTVFDVIGSEGTLFSIDDDLDGVIFTANDRTGLPVLEASASGEVYIGKAPQSLYTTAVISSTTAATTQSIFGLSTSSYGGAFFDYTVQSGSNARAGSIMSVWNGSSINFTETTTTDIGDTTDFNVIVHISESQAQIASHATRAGYNIKTIIRSI